MADKWLTFSGREQRYCHKKAKTFLDFERDLLIWEKEYLWKESIACLEEEA